MLCTLGPAAAPRRAGRWRRESNGSVKLPPLKSHGSWVQWASLGALDSANTERCPSGTCLVLYVWSSGWQVHHLEALLDDGEEEEGAKDQS